MKHIWCISTLPLHLVFQTFPMKANTLLCLALISGHWISMVCPFTWDVKRRLCYHFFKMCHTCTYSDYISWHNFFLTIYYIVIQPTPINGELLTPGKKCARLSQLNLKEYSSAVPSGSAYKVSLNFGQSNYFSWTALLFKKYFNKSVPLIFLNYILVGLINLLN